MTVTDIITDAYRKIGVAATDEPLDADQIAAGVRAFNRLMRSFQNREPDLFLKSSEDVTLSNVAEYSLGHCKPRQINSSRIIRNGVETPMHALTRQEYDDLPVKTSTGLPTTYYFDRQKCDGTIYVWPVLSGGDAIMRITYEREMRDVEAGDKSPFPAEWEEALVYGLASRLADDYGLNLPNVMARAADELRLVLARDREGSIWFHDTSGFR